jgi:hypothetical protein
LEIRVKRGEEKRRFLGFGEEGRTLERRGRKEARKLAYLSVGALVRGKGALELEGRTIVGKQASKTRRAQGLRQGAHKPRQRGHISSLAGTTRKGAHLPRGAQIPRRVQVPRSM